MDMKPVLAILPPKLRQSTEGLRTGALEELRLRAGRPPTAVLDGKECILPGCAEAVTSRMLEEIVSAATNRSCYSAEASLREGYVTLPGGHRIGLCGTAALRESRIQSLRELSSVSIRIARQVACAPPELLRRLDASTLILGPPGSGKTTLLRECVRSLSDGGSRVGLVDERGELAACRLGVPQLDVGAQTDVLTGCGKSEGIYLLLRAMNPQWIAVDEITAPEDIRAMEEASYCGVRFLATAHAFSPDELRRRPLYRRLRELELFQRLLILSPDKHVTMERMA